MHWISNDPSMRMIRPREIESSNIVRRHRSDDLCLPLLVGWCSDWEHILSLRFKQTERARRCARFFLSSLVWLWISAFKLRHPQFSAEFETFQYLQTTHYIQTTVLSPQDNGQVWIRNLLPWVDILHSSLLIHVQLPDLSPTSYKVLFQLCSISLI